MFPRTVSLLCVVMLIGGSAQGDVIIETVHVGNPGNAGELSGAGAGGFGDDVIVGSVSYEYNIGKYEVTAGQCTFSGATSVTSILDLPLVLRGKKPRRLPECLRSRFV